VTAALGSGMGSKNKRHMSKGGTLLLGGLASLLLVNAAWRLFEGDDRNVVISWVVIALCLVSYGYAFWAYRRAVKTPPAHD
jgi:CHASE2 domain-containing sensor protein